MIGEFPNLSAEDRHGILVIYAQKLSGSFGVQALPPWLPDRPGWNHAAFFAEVGVK